MFVEVYGVKLTDWKSPAVVSKTEENRRVVELTGARLRPFQQQPDKCEIKLPNGISIICAGSYDQVVKRIADGLNTSTIIRVTPDN